MIIEDEIEKIKEKWFIEEPLYFLAQSVFRITLSDSVLTISAAPKHIYIGRTFAKRLTAEKLESVLKLELIRVLLRHPFTRYTNTCDSVIAYISSQIAIHNIMKFNGLEKFDCNKFLSRNGLLVNSENKKYDISGIEHYSYEEIYKLLSRIIKKENVNLENIVGCEISNTYDEIMSATKYWGDDVTSISNIWNIIGHINNNSNRKGGFGSIPGNVIERITADDPPEYDYKEPLRRFKHSVISSNKRLTRRRPNRRYGYDAMGSIYEYTSNVLIVCDTSGSMTQNELGKFIGFINGFLSSGFSSIDCVQFDSVVIDSTLEQLKRKVYEYDFSGRGGTNITDIINFVNLRAKKKYDGVVVFTDGGFEFDEEKWDANLRENKTRYIFCITDEELYEYQSKKMTGLPNLDLTYLDINNKW